MDRKYYVFPNGLVMVSDDGGGTYQMFQGNYLLHKDVPGEVVESAIEVFLKMDNPSRDYICPKCGKEFVRSDGMNEYTCECGLSFKVPGK